MLLTIAGMAVTGVVTWAVCSMLHDCEVPARDAASEARAQAWDDKADELLATALTNEAEGYVYIARDGRKSARRARMNAKKIRKGKA